MSRNSKNSKRHAAARQMSETRKSGGSGPAKTAAKHGKKRAWWQLFSSYTAYIKSGGKLGRKSADGEAS